MTTLDDIENQLKINHKSIHPTTGDMLGEKDKTSYLTYFLYEHEYEIKILLAINKDITDNKVLFLISQVSEISININVLFSESY